MKYKRKKSYWQQGIRRFEYLWAAVLGMILIGAISYLFYGTCYCAILFSPYLIRYIKSWEKQTIKKRKQSFRLQFKEMIQSMSSALNVGYSVENALREANKDLKGLYKKDEMILQEISKMVRQIQMNINVEQAFRELAMRTEDEEVLTFVTVFNMAKRSGGDTLEIIRNAVRQIGETIDVEREIAMIISAKRMEFRIMSVIPFAIIIYLKVCFPEFLQVLYGNLMGIVIMSICLILYVLAYEVGKRMVEIEV